MPDIQEIIALGIVAVVAGWLLWKRRLRRNAPPKTGSCGDCVQQGPPPKEATLRFYRRRNAEDPASGAPDDET
jgi:hypothetical protein